MCGITGFWDGQTVDPLIARRMALRIDARGPDDAGVWCDASHGLALAHRRLAVIDLSPAGHQPMVSPCGRFVIVYNGEIYNHLELRQKLETEGAGYHWRGHSDTETLLAAISHWGIRGTLERLNGMFAFALWDCSEKSLFLARDRMGEKPLYYGRTQGTFLFGSELKALIVHPSWDGRIDRSALTLYMRHNYVPSPWSIYEGIRKVPPGHFVVIREYGRCISQPVCYWNLEQIAKVGSHGHPSDTSEIQTDRLEALLRDSVGRRMSADVPLGAFLSGGYDSSTVVALMQAQSERPVKTFSIGFHEEGYNEAVHAKCVARHLGTDHTELYVSPEEVMAVIPNLPHIYDEPFADSSQIPTFLVSKLARRHVTVSLSGDGGDELFYGYGRYFAAQNAWRKLGKVPLALRRAAAWLARNAPAEVLEGGMRWLPKRLRMEHFADRLPKIAELLSHSNDEDFYRQLVSHWAQPEQLVLGASEPATIFDQHDMLAGFSDFPNKMMYLDQVTYLPGDILTKVDRASMSVSLEARVPLLDHRLVEFAWGLPMDLKYRNGQSKWLLRQVLYRHLPRELMERPKMGFGIPLEHWLRGPLRDWAEGLLNEDRLRNEGFFDPVPVRRMWSEHVSGSRRWHACLWDVLMFQAWLEVNPDAY